MPGVPWGLLGTSWALPRASRAFLGASGRPPRAAWGWVEDVEMLVGVPPRGALLGLSLGAPRALLGSLVKKEGHSCPRKHFREHDVVRSPGGPVEACRGGPFGAGWAFLRAYGRPRRASSMPLDDLRKPPGAFGPSRHRAWAVAQRPLECSLGSRGTSLGGFWAAVLKPIGEMF